MTPKDNLPTYVGLSVGIHGIQHSWPGLTAFEVCDRVRVAVAFAFPDLEMECDVDVEIEETA